MTAPTQTIERFARAFRENVSSCRAVCNCGREFYNPDGSWSWEPGELDALAADPKATAIDYSVGYIKFEGKTYLDACDCWHKRATQIAAFIESHDHGIAKYLSLRKQDHIRRAESLPTVE